MTPAHPDLEALLQEALANHQPITLAEARQRLGNAFRESDLANETIHIREHGADIRLPPTTWIRLVRQAQQRRHP